MTNLGASALGTGALNLRNAGALTVSGAVDATGGVTLNAGGPLALNQSVNAGAAVVDLSTTGSGNAITQGASGVITAGTLSLTTADASATLNTATSAVQNLGAASLGSGRFAFKDDAPGGLTVSNATVSAQGGIDIVNTTGHLATSGALSASAGNIRLHALATGKARKT